MSDANAMHARPPRCYELYARSDGALTAYVERFTSAVLAAGGRIVAIETAVTVGPRRMARVTFYLPHAATAGATSSAA